MKKPTLGSVPLEHPQGHREGDSAYIAGSPQGQDLCHPPHLAQSNHLILIRHDQRPTMCQVARWEPMLPKE